MAAVTIRQHVPSGRPRRAQASRRRPQSPAHQPDERRPETPRLSQGLPFSTFRQQAMSSALACCPAALARPGKTPLRTTRCGHSIRATPTPTRPQGPFVSRSRPIVAARSQLEEVDPVTGEILTSPARAPLARQVSDFFAPKAELLKGK